MKLLEDFVFRIFALGGTPKNVAPKRYEFSPRNTRLIFLDPFGGSGITLKGGHCRDERAQGLGI